MRLAALALALGVAATPAAAHLNSPHAQLEASVAGHDVMAVVHLPQAVPGEAQAQLRILDLAPGEAAEVLFRQVPPQGDDHAPQWTRAERSAQDPAFFSAPMPLMVFGMFEAEFSVTTARGQGDLRVPVTAASPKPPSMKPPVIATLVALSAFLVATIFVIARAVVADAARDMGLPRTLAQARRGLAAGSLAAAGFAGFTGFTGFTWRTMHRAFEVRAMPELQADWVVRSGTPRVGSPVDALVVLADRDGAPATSLLADGGERLHVTVVSAPGAESIVHVHGREIEPGRFEVTWTPQVAGRHVVFVDAATRASGAQTIVQEIVVGPSFGGPRVPLAPVALLPAVGGATASSSALAPGAAVTWPAIADAVRAGDVLPIEPTVASADSGLAIDHAELLVLREDLLVFDRLQPSAPGTLRFAYGFPRPGRYRLALTVPSPSGSAVAVRDVVAR